MSFIANSISRFVSSGANAITHFAAQAVNTVKAGAAKVATISKPIFPLLKNMADNAASLGRRYSVYMNGTPDETDLLPPSLSRFLKSRPGLFLQFPEILPEEEIASPEAAPIEAPSSFAATEFTPPVPTSLYAPSSTGSAARFTSKLAGLSPKPFPTALASELGTTAIEEILSAVKTPLSAHSFSLQPSFKSIETPDGSSLPAPSPVAGAVAPPLAPFEVATSVAQPLDQADYSSSPVVEQPIGQTPIEQYVSYKISEQAALPKGFLSIRAPTQSQNRYAEKLSINLQPSIAPIWTSDLVALAVSPSPKTPEIYRSSNPALKTPEKSAPFQSLSLPQVPLVHFSASSFAPPAPRTFPFIDGSNRATLPNNAPSKSEVATQIPVQAQGRIEVNLRPVPVRSDARIYPAASELRELFLSLGVPSDPIVSNAGEKQPVDGLLEYARTVETDRKRAEQTADQAKVRAKVEMDEEMELKAREQAVLWQAKDSFERAAIQHSSQQEAARRQHEREESRRSREAFYKKAYEGPKYLNYPQLPKRYPASVLSA